MSNGFLEKNYLIPENINFPEKRPSAILYEKFKCGQSDEFNAYLDHELLKDSIPNDDWKRLTEDSAEIHSNAILHSETDTIFVCGQYFPKKRRINFSIVDIGIGFRECLRRSRHNFDYSSLDAIEWTIKEGHTKKTKEMGSGGLGLSNLCKTAKDHRGVLQIISNDGFWEYNEEE